jgi:hypothetical protein
MKGSDMLEVDRSNRNHRPLNIQVPEELKQSLMEMSRRYDRTLATVVRTILRIGLPLLQGVWDAEMRMLEDPEQLLRRGSREDA